MALRVERRDVGAVGDAVDRPLLDPERRAQRVHVGDAVVGEVVVAARRRAASRTAPPPCAP